MSQKVKLHAPAGMAELHIDDAIHAVDENGRVEVPAHHVEHALSLGASRSPLLPMANVADAHAALAERVSALEAQLADLLKKKR